jgi:6-phosphogluconolactonase (cycloisomerase 2 family)
MIKQFSIYIFLYSIVISKTFAFSVSNIAIEHDCFGKGMGNFDSEQNLLITATRTEVCVHRFSPEDEDPQLVFSHKFLLGHIPSDYNYNTNQSVLFEPTLKKLFASTDNGILRIFDWNVQESRFDPIFKLDETEYNIAGDRPILLSLDKRHLYYGAHRKLVVIDLSSTIQKNQEFELPNLREHESIYGLTWASDHSMLTVVTAYRILAFERNFQNGELTYISETIFTEGIARGVLQTSTESTNLHLYIDGYDTSSIAKFSWDPVERNWKIAGDFLQGKLSTTYYQKEMRGKYFFQVTSSPGDGPEGRLLEYYVWDDLESDYILVDTIVSNIVFNDFQVLHNSIYIRDGNRYQKYNFTAHGFELVGAKQANNFSYLGNIKELVWSPNGRFFYAIEDNQLKTFSVNSENKIISRIQTASPLTYSRSQPMSQGLITISSDNRFLYLYNGKLHVYAIEQDTGLLNKLDVEYQLTTAPLGANNNTMSINPKTNFLYIFGTNLRYLGTQGYIGAVKLDDVSGLPQYDQSIIVGWQFPEDVAFSNSTNMMYVLYSNYAEQIGGALQAISHDPISGEFQLLQEVKYPTGTYSNSLAITNNDEHLYVSTGSGIEIMTVNPEGLLDLESTPRLVNPGVNNGITISKDQRFLSVLSRNQISQFSIGENASLALQRRKTLGITLGQTNSDTADLRVSPDETMYFAYSPHGVTQQIIFDRLEPVQNFPESLNFTLSNLDQFLDLSINLGLISDEELLIISAPPELKNALLTEGKLYLNTSRDSLKKTPIPMTVLAFNGQDFQYISLNIDIELPNNPPSAESIQMQVNDGEFYQGKIEFEDIDSDLTNVRILTYPIHGRLSWNDQAKGIYTYTAELNSEGQDSFEFVVSDPFVDSESATVDISIIKVQREINVQDDFIEIVSGSDIEIEIDFKSNDQLLNIELAEIEITIDFNQTIGSTELQEDGTLLYRVSNDFIGVDNVSYTLKSAKYDISSSATVSIQVVNIPPEAVDDNYNVLSGEVAVLDIILNDSDENGVIDSNSIQIATSPIYGRLSMEPAGKVSYTSNSAYVGNDSFTYKIKDNNGDFSKELATVSIFVKSQSTQPPNNITNKDESGGGSMYLLLFYLLSLVFLREVRTLRGRAVNISYKKTHCRNAKQSTLSISSSVSPPLLSSL